MRNLLRTMLRWLDRLTTSSDNKTPDVIRLGSILIGAQFLGLTAWDVMVMKSHFDALTYSGGAAAILASTGAALGFRRKEEEPKASA